MVSSFTVTYNGTLSGNHTTLGSVAAASAADQSIAGATIHTAASDKYASGGVLPSASEDGITAYSPARGAAGNELHAGVKRASLRKEITGKNALDGVRQSLDELFQQPWAAAMDLQVENW
jgi:hypothetical protein